MYHPRFYGDFYEMGFKYGSLLHQKGVQLPALTQAKAEFGTQCYQALQRFYPELIEEIKGFSAGLRIEEAFLGAFVAGIGVFDMTGKCSAFGFRNTNAVVFGRNYDMLFALKQFTESSLTAPAHKFAHISQSDLFLGRADGINEKGLAIAMSFVNGTTIQPGITFHFIIRKVLENCDTVASAVETIRSAKITSANNFLIADKQGTLAVVEAAPEGSEVRYPQYGDSFVCISNQFETEKMTAFDRGGLNWSKTKERYQKLESTLSAAESIDLDCAKEIMSDRCVCLNLKKEKFGTLWSVVADLKALKIERAEGKPKIDNYKPETRLDWWLKKKSS